MKKPTTQQLRLVTAAITEGNTSAVAKLIADDPTLRNQDVLRRFLYTASDDTNMIETLIAAGADINHGQGPDRPEGIINDAVTHGYKNAIACYLKHGAILNYTVDGERRSFPLTGAVINGDLELVKLLIAHGADPNAVWRGDSNALSFAMMYKQTEIEAYLRSIGAKEPHELVGPKSTPDGNDAVLLEHIRQHHGNVAPVSLTQLIPIDPPVRIHVATADDGRLALVTTGMSAKPLNSPAEMADFRRIEFALLLPAGWPVGPNAMSKPQHAWPFTWLMTVAANTRAAGNHLPPVTIVDCGEPLWPGTKMSCLMLNVQQSDFCVADLPDGRHILFYYVVPLFPQERDYEKRAGFEALFQALGNKGYGLRVVPDRKPVV